MKRNTAHKEAQQQEITKLTGELMKGVEKMRSSEEYIRMLNTASAFPEYSFNNQLLICMQKPDASYVCGYKAWNKLGRHVLKGEHGIRILAPLVYKEEDEETGEVKTKVRGYKAVSVFDISQTEGAPITTASNIVHDLHGNVENFTALMDAVKSVAAFPVEYGELGGDCNGLCRYDAGVIVLQEGMSELQQLSTLIHETAHSILHGPQCKKSRKVRELEAESVAYIACRHFGINSGTQSFEYVTVWTTGMSNEDIVSCFVDLHAEAAKIIRAIETAMTAPASKAA